MFTVNAEGVEKKLLTEQGGIWPEWSPDGTKLLFTRGGKLFLLRPGRGAEPRFLLSAAIDAEVHWSPDGRRIVFATNHGIEVANADGSGRRLLLRDQLVVFADPDWSPDGRQIVLTGVWPSPLTWPWAPEQIYVMRANGTGLRLLTEDIMNAHRDPTWSPDGRSILFARCLPPWTKNRDASDLVLLRPDGSKETTIARLGSSCARIVQWSPDGRRILYLDDQNGVQMINADGSAKKRLLPWTLGLYGFSWQALR